MSFSSLLRMFTILTIALITQAKSPHRFILSSSNKEQSFKSNYSQNKFQNIYEIQLAEEDLLDDKSFFLVFESSNPNFIVSILKEQKSAKQRVSVLMDLITFSGNIAMAMSNTYFNSKLDFFKDSGFLRFVISTESQEGDMEYNVRVQVGNEMNLSFGKTYTTRLDSTLPNLKTKASYNGKEQKNLQKLRFQITSVKQRHEYSLKATLEYKTQAFTMNNVFQKSVGGILTKPILPVCTDETCDYMMTITFQKVKVINIETFFIQEIETLDVNHYEEYYDRTYTDNVVSYYKLPYIETMEGLDISVSLIPVTGSSGLYINAKTRPLSLDKYDWKETNTLAKRITIKWEELELMKASKSELYIAVQTSSPGEFLIKIDAHEAGFKGRLSSGITEAGFVKFNELNNYLYVFEVFETQVISFKIDLNVISGDADLYLKGCKGNKTCTATLADLPNTEILKVENTHNKKELQYNFTCERHKNFNATSCKFLIIVKGKENHGTHFDLSFHQNNYHRLMLPGNLVHLNLIASEKVYLKFSYPHSSPEKELFLEVENIWGDSQIFLSKTVMYPDEKNNSKMLEFQSQKAGLLNSMQSIPFASLDLPQPMQGVYYISVVSKTTCAINLKFFEKKKSLDLTKPQKVSIHTLTSGQQTRGELHNSDEIQYYTIRACLDKKIVKTYVNLTPLKGDFVIFANKNGELPTRNSHQYYSESNRLEIPMYCNGSNVQEYFIGIQNSKNSVVTDSRSQFIIDFTYAGKALRLSPGILGTYVLEKESANQFFIQLHKSMKNLMILKTIVDGYNIDLCASFGKSEELMSNEKCELSAQSKNVSLFINEEILKTKCQDFKEKCFLHLKVHKGSHNEKFQLGYTYNDQPFHLNKSQILTGPIPVGQGVLNFVYHPEITKPCTIYFNSKGSNATIYTKLIKSEDYKSKALDFPTQSDSKDIEDKTGFVENIVYTKSQLEQQGNRPEILISVRSSQQQHSDYPFDNNHFFLIEIHTDSTEIIRTHSNTLQIEKDEWNYFNFYSNGNSQSLRINVNSTGQDNLEVLLSKGLQSRPPMTNQALISKTGIANVMLTLQREKQQGNVQKNNIKGHFVVAVKSKTRTTITIFWNNKQDLNYIEITPNKPNLMNLEEKRNFYFSFYAKDTNSGKKNDRGKVVIYIKTSVPAVVYILKSNDNGMQAPSKTNFTWKTTTGVVGGLSSIEILPSDPDYCMNCHYIGHIEAKRYGTVNILADIEHSNVPIFLLPNIEFPNFLDAHEQKVFKVNNPDSDLLNLTVNMLSGFVDVFVSEKPNVSDRNFKESYSLRKNLEAHKLIVIAPAVKYNIHKAHDFFIMIKNTTDKPASMFLTVDKNDISSPISPGLKKYFRLAPGETKNCFYTPTEDENTFQVQMELRTVYKKSYKKQALSLMSDYLQIYHVNSVGDRYILKYKRKSVHENRVYIDFDISENSKGTFTIHIYNPVGSGVNVSLDLINGGYRLLHLNEHTQDVIPSNKSRIFEAYGQVNKFLFFDMKMCQGDVNVSFYESDYQDVVNGKTQKYKTMKDSNSFMHYIKMTNKRIFLKVENVKKKNAVFDMSAFVERDLQNSPYAEVSQLLDGKVMFESDTKTVRFQALKIKSNYEENFLHEIIYTVYLTPSMMAMRYLKNCGGFMVDLNFPNTDILSFTTKMTFDVQDAISHLGVKTIKLDHLKKSTKYYGVLVAEVRVFPKDVGFLSPVRSNKVFYDEFIFVSSKYDIPFVYMMTTFISIGIIGVVFCFVKNYIFGKINRMHGLQTLSDFSNIDDGAMGITIMKAMESDFFKEMQEEEQEKQETEQKDEDQKQPEEDDIEQKMKDEMEMKQIEMTENPNSN